LPEDFFIPPLSMHQYEKTYAPFYKRFDHTLFHQCLHEFELPEGHALEKLSYGQQKKFLIAFGIATQCPLLILDEPTNGLDIPSKSQFRKQLARALTEEKLFIISTHQVRDMAYLIDPIIILDEGKIIFHEPAEIITQKLSFEARPDLEDQQSLLYWEPGVNGYRVVAINSLGLETDIELEALFNAILANKHKLDMIFGGK
jgi:ABC-2 type transport system ATP-binding protein